MKRAVPQSANEVLEVTHESHNWKHEPLEMNSTGGIQRSILALRAQVKALADYIDGKITDSDGNLVNKEGQRIDAEGNVIQPEPEAAVA